jgi:hypothetical protein
MEKIFNNFDLNEKANQIIRNLDDISESMTNMMDFDNKSSSSKRVLKSITETPIEFANNVFKENMANLRFLNNHVDSFDESLIELNNGFAIIIIGILKFPISQAQILASIIKDKESKETAEVIKVRKQLTEIAEILLRLTRLNIGILVKTNINSIQKQIQTIEKKIDPNSGCFIATYIYNDYSHPNVIGLRRFRDNVLSEFILGRKITSWYYIISPIIIKHLNSYIIKVIFKPILIIITKLTNKIRYD